MRYILLVLVIVLAGSILMGCSDDSHDEGEDELERQISELQEQVEQMQNTPEPTPTKTITTSPTPSPSAAPDPCEGVTCSKPVVLDNNSGGAIATRNLPPAIEKGEVFTVTLTTDLVNGVIQEYLPKEIAFVGTESIVAPCNMIVTYRPCCHKLEFVYMGVLPGQCTPDTFSYDVIAPQTLGSYQVEGFITEVVLDTKVHNLVAGDTSIIID